MRMGWGSRICPGGAREDDAARARSSGPDRRRLINSTAPALILGRPNGDSQLQDRRGERNQVSGYRAGNAHLDQRPAEGMGSDPITAPAVATQRGSGQDVGPGRADSMVPAEEIMAGFMGQQRMPSSASEKDQPLGRAERSLQDPVQGDQIPLVYQRRLAQQKPRQQRARARRM